MSKSEALGFCWNQLLTAWSSTLGAAGGRGVVGAGVVAAGTVGAAGVAIPIEAGVAPATEDGPATAVATGDVAPGGGVVAAGLVAASNLA